MAVPTFYRGRARSARDPPRTGPDQHRCVAVVGLTERLAEQDDTAGEAPGLLEVERGGPVRSPERGPGSAPVEQAPHGQRQTHPDGDGAQHQQHTGRGVVIGARLGRLAASGLVRLVGSEVDRC